MNKSNFMLENTTVLLLPFPNSHVVDHPLRLHMPSSLRAVLTLLLFSAVAHARPFHLAAAVDHAAVQAWPGTRDALRTHINYLRAEEVAWWSTWDGVNLLWDEVDLATDYTGVWAQSEDVAPLSCTLLMSNPPRIGQDADILVRFTGYAGVDSCATIRTHCLDVRASIVVGMDAAQNWSLRQNIAHALGASHDSIDCASRTDANSLMCDGATCMPGVNRYYVSECTRQQIDAFLLCRTRCVSAANPIEHHWASGARENERRAIKLLVLAAMKQHNELNPGHKIDWARRFIDVDGAAEEPFFAALWQWLQLTFGTEAPSHAAVIDALVHANSLESPGKRLRNTTSISVRAVQAWLNIEPADGDWDNPKLQSALARRRAWAWGQPHCIRDAEGASARHLHDLFLRSMLQLCASCSGGTYAVLAGMAAFTMLLACLGHVQYRRKQAHVAARKERGKATRTSTRANRQSHTLNEELTM